MTEAHDVDARAGRQRREEQRERIGRSAFATCLDGLIGVNRKTTEGGIDAFTAGKSTTISILASTDWEPMR